MNKFSRALRHIDIEDVREKHLRNESVQKIKEEQQRIETDKIKEREEYVSTVMEHKAYNWRKDIEIPEKEDVVIEEETLFGRVRSIEPVVNEQMTTTGVFSYMLDGSRSDDLHVFQTGFTGGDASYTPYADNPTNGEYTALTNLDYWSNVSDPLGLGKGVRSDLTDPGLAGAHPNVDTGSSGYMLSIPGYSSGMRGARVSGSYSSYPYVNTKGATDESIPKNEFLDDYISNKVGTHLSFYADISPRIAAFKPIDSTTFDTISMNAFLYGLIGSSGEYAGVPSPSHGTKFPEENTGIYIYYWAGDKEGAKGYNTELNSYSENHDGWRPINRKPDGTLDASYSSEIIPWKPNQDYSAWAQQYHGHYPSQELMNFKLTIPPWARGPNTRFMVVQRKLAGSTSNHNWGMTSLRFQRRVPMSVIAPLDSPEGSAFIRNSIIGSKVTDPKKRKKAVEDQLKASKQYTNKVLGKDFPGMGASLDSITKSPIGKEEVKQRFSDDDKKSKQREWDAEEQERISRRLDQRNKHHKAIKTGKGITYKTPKKSESYWFKQPRGPGDRGSSRTPESAAKYRADQLRKSRGQSVGLRDKQKSEERKRHSQLRSSEKLNRMKNSSR